MSLSAVATVALVVYALVASVYVYRWRGQTRYPGFSQYLRKSWPIFAPLNCLLYLSTRRFARKPVLDAGYLDGIEVLRAHWPQIRDEALALHRAGELDATAQPGAVGYHDLGFRTFYKRGWRKFQLTWYDEPHPSARRLCPETVRLLQQVPGMRAAMFSVLPAGAELTLHADPLACSLRYHPGLQTPNSDDCFIDVDGHRLSWRDGQDFVFDETYPHHAHNGSADLRLILMCDVERPMHFAGRLFNRMYSCIPQAFAVPNTPEDRRGAISALFAAVTPWRERALQLRTRNRAVYRLLKHTFNAGLLALLLLFAYAMLGVMERTGQAAFG